MTKDVLYFAKMDSQAVIPTKRDEDGGYDVHALIEPRETEHEGIVHEQLLEKDKVNFVGTGVASAMSSKYALSFQHERSSVAKNGMVVVAGLIDSGYRSEIKLMVIPMVKDILITSEVSEVEEYEDVILYPYSKAISQFTILLVPEVDVMELPYDDLLSIASERRFGGWGSSGK